MTPSDGDASPRPSRPTREQLEAIASGATMDSQVLEYLKNWDDGTVQMELKSLQEDQDFLDEFITANRDKVKGDAPITEQPAPDGYEIIRELDRGAQGVVFLARQIRTKRRVALKMIIQAAFSTERQKQRFEREVELVASMKHPNIVTVFDSGVTPDGRLFTAMEYIDGVPMNLFRVQDGSEEGRAPTQTEQIQLLLKVCEAVTSAHRRGIIHRDLKPLNILVDRDSEPHVLDFGLAKVVGPEAMSESAMAATAAGEFMGTFAYASPEQVSGDPDLIDTRTDVYALGVIFYELLLKRRPYELGGSINDMIRGIMEVQPFKPTTIDPNIDRDLETIMLIALAKDTTRRYQSVKDFSDDLEHWLAGEPILARRDDAWYVLQKYVRRHRIPVALAAGFVLLLIGFAITMSVLFAQVSIANKRLAGTLGMASEVIASADPENNRQALSATTAVDMLEAWSDVVHADLADEPGISSRLLNDLGESYIGFDRYNEAEQHLQEALEALNQIDPEPSEERARALHNLGRVSYKRADWQQAYEAYDEALQMRRQILEPQHIDIAESFHHRGSTLRRLGEVELAEQDMRTSLGIFELQLKRAANEYEAAVIRGKISSVLNGLGLVLSRTSPEKAIIFYSEAIDLHKEGPESTEEKGTMVDWRIGRLLHNIGMCHYRLGNLTEARESLESSLFIKQAGIRRLQEQTKSAEEVSSGNQLQLASGKQALAIVLLQLDDVDSAWPLVNEGHEIRSSVLQPGHPLLADSRQVIASIRLQRGEHEAAQKELESILDERMSRNARAEVIAITQSLLGTSLMRQGHYEEAEPLLIEAYETLTSSEGPGVNSRDARQTASILIELYEAWGRPDEAQKYQSLATTGETAVQTPD